MQESPISSAAGLWQLSVMCAVMLFESLFATVPAAANDAVSCSEVLKANASTPNEAQRDEAEDHPLPDARVGEPYEYGVAYQGMVEPVTACWSGEWPAGIRGMGAIVAGTPKATRPEPFRFTVILVDALSTRLVRDYTVRVRPAIQPLQLSTDSLPVFIQGENMTFRVAAQGGEGLYRWQGTATRLPAGLKLSCSARSDGCVLSGAATEPAEIQIQVSVSDGVRQAGLATLRGHVIEPPPAELALCDDGPPAGIVGHSYRHHLCATGGHPPYRWMLNWAGAVPPAWIRFDPTRGVLEGTPTYSDTLQFSVSVADTLSKQKTRNNMTLEVAPVAARGPLTLVPQQMPVAVVGQPYLATLAVLNARGTVRWDIDWGQTPAWASISKRGDTVIFTGEPKETGQWHLRVKAMDVEARSDAHGPGKLLGSVEQVGYVLAVIEGLPQVPEEPTAPPELE